MVAADRSAMGDTFGQLHQAKKNLANLLLGPQDVQAAAVSKQLAQIAQLKQELAQHETGTVLAIRAILTPDQLAKAAAAKDQTCTWPHHKGTSDTSNGTGT